MGMSHNAVPAEGYVSVIAYDPISGGHHIQNIQASQPQLMQQQAQQFTVPQFAMAPMTALRQEPQQQQQTLLLVSPANGDHQHQVMMTTADLPKTSPLLVFTTDLQEQQSHILRLPVSANVIQVSGPASGATIHVQQPSADAGAMAIISADVPHHNHQITLDPSANVSLVQVPNTLLLNNNVILCLQQPDDTTTYHLTTSELPMNGTITESVVDDTYATTAAAKGWYMDADIANRALSALEREQTTQGNPVDPLYRNSCMSVSSEYNT